MIPNGEGKLSALLKGVTSKNNVDFYCLICLHSFRTYRIKKYMKIRIFFNIIMSSEDTRIFEFNQYHKSNKTPFIIYADLEF